MAALVTRSLSEWGVTFSVPIALAAIVVGVAAAALPARRASRLDVLRALQYE